MILNELIKRLETNSIDYYLTKFLTQEDVTKIKQIKNTNLVVYSFGGFSNSERERMIIQNASYITPTNDDFEISVIKITIPKIDKSIIHRNILGLLMSLGIKRESLGDIVIKDNEYYIYVVKEMVNFLKCNITRINQYLVNPEEVPLDSIQIEIKTVEKEINISSNRLDAIISKTYNLSRDISQSLITKGLVQVNHQEELHHEKSLKNDDLVSVRGYGRFIFKGIYRTTKKDRLVGNVEIFQ